MRPRGIHIRLRGRRIRLPGLRQPPPGPLRWLAVLGPGVIAGAAANDAGSIATYSSVGASYGYVLLWTLVVGTVALAVVQEMAARLGVATGRGLLDLIRERFGLGWSVFAVIVMVVANGGLILSEFVGIGAAAGLVGVSPLPAILAAAAIVWGLVVFGSYDNVERIFLVMTLVFFTYPVAAVLAHPDWGAVARGAVVPTLRPGAAFILLVVALLGTTLTPYQQLFEQSSIVEKSVPRQHYRPERFDTYIGMALSGLMAGFIVIATAATLHAHGVTQINTAADAARALQPVAGNAAEMLFAVGLLGASMLAAAVLPLATAYAIAEAFGFPKGVNLDFRRGRVFFSAFTALIVGGTAAASIPGLPVISLLVWVQALNGVLLPIILLFILLLINDRGLVGDLANSRLTNALGWGTLVIVTVAVVALLGT
ncbi:MAG TPA: Nramp family divalent metal transporter, partial [Thermomicrobiales bacterium]|nr:Nramp family divalent metal transporter [Thermomicrobiales bacterium]